MSTGGVNSAWGCEGGGGGSWGREDLSTFESLGKAPYGEKFVKGRTCWMWKGREGLEIADFWGGQGTRGCEQWGKCGIHYL